MPESILNIFKNTFSRIPQRVVWQWKNPSSDLKMPSNVLLVDWMPQQDLLGISSALKKTNQPNSMC